jgi:hypothetical protein
MSVRVKGDFLYHCHIEEHMMAGLGGLVRARDWVWVDPETAWSSDLRLPLDDGRNDLEWAISPGARSAIAKATSTRGIPGHTTRAAGRT